MEHLRRIYRLHQILASRRTPASLETLQKELDCSRATVNRAIREARLFFNAPLEYDRERNGYHYDPKAGNSFELPGLLDSQLKPLKERISRPFSRRFNTLLHIRRCEFIRTEAPDCANKFAPTPTSTEEFRINNLFASEHLGSGEIAKRVRILRMAGRNISSDRFQTAAGALLQRKCP